MADYRISEHPILAVPDRRRLEFFWEGRALTAVEGETISSALFANGIRIFGRHPKDGAPLGIFCANGQCAQCSVMADGRPVKSCMEPIRDGLRVEPMNGPPVLPDVGGASGASEPMPGRAPETIEVECLIIGGGPAGLSAAVELGKSGVRALVVDDKHRLGGKLVLQTHKFFGSIEACHAGTRGIDIASRLERAVAQYENVRVWLNSTALAVFSDRRVGVLREGRYVVVHPQVLLVASGAREKSLVFRGNTLPGVYGAGAFQTLVNRDLVRPTEKLFIIGGGNVGLIAGYHALQAGIGVVGLCEALPDCGGYKVHKDKLVRMGVPLFTSHTVVAPDREAHYEAFFQRAKRRGYTPAEARVHIRNSPTALAAVLLRTGEADAMISGTVGGYRSHLEQIELIIGRAKGVDHMAAMTAVVLPSGPLFIADTDVQADPDTESLVEITALCAAEVRRFGIKPKVALLSHSNFGSHKDASALKMHEALCLIQHAFPELEVEGEMRADLALSHAMRQQRFPDSLLEGRANLLIMPNQDAANIAFNLLKVMGDGTAIGPILLGAAKSAHVVTPGVTVRGLLNMTALAAVQAR